MKKLLFLSALLFLSIEARAGFIINPITGRPDYVGSGSASTSTTGNYIQNTLTPTTTTQVFSVAAATITTQLTVGSPTTAISGIGLMMQGAYGTDSSKIPFGFINTSAGSNTNIISIPFRFKNSSQVSTDFSNFRLLSEDATAGSERGDFSVGLMDNGTLRSGLGITGIVGGGLSYSYGGFTAGDIHSSFNGSSNIGEFDWINSGNYFSFLNPLTITASDNSQSVFSVTGSIVGPTIGTNNIQTWNKIDPLSFDPVVASSISFNGEAWFPAVNSATFTATGLFSGNGSGLTSLNASNLVSGTVGTARLGSGSATSSTFLRGDNTWATPFYIQNTNTLQSGSTFYTSSGTVNGQFTAVASSANITPIISRGAASQTATLFELRNIAGTLLSSFDSSGRLGIGTAPSFGIDVLTGSTNAERITSSSPSSTIFTMSNSSSNVNWSMNAVGAVPVGGLSGVPAGSFNINNGVNFMTLSPSGLSVGLKSPSGTLHVQSGSVGAKVSIFQGTAGQTGNITEWWDSTGVVLSSVTAGGVITGPHRAIGHTISWFRANAPISAATGEQYYCDDCTLTAVAVSTGSTAGSWGTFSAKTTFPN